MALSNAANGTADVALNTPLTLTTETTAGGYQLTIDLSEMASGDTVTISSDVKTLTGSTAAESHTITLSGAQDSPVFVSVPIAVEHSIAYIVEQTAGTARDFDWSVAYWSL